MQHQTYHWKNKKGQSIFAQSWMPDGKPRAVICHIHGQSDHSSRFEHVAAFFNIHHIAFFAADLIGHGKSEGKRGHVMHYAEYLETVDQLIDEASRKFPDLPLFVYGHSTGGQMVLQHSMQSDKNIRGYIVTSPLIRIAFEPPAWKVALAKKVRKIFPALSQPTGLDASGISRDKEVVNRYVADKMVHGKITVSAFFEIMKNGKDILLKADKLKYPILMLHGTADKITSQPASQELASLRKDLITYKTYEGLYHEIHNEPEKEQVLNDILSWIELKLNS